MLMFWSFGLLVFWSLGLLVFWAVGLLVFSLFSFLVLCFLGAFGVLLFYSMKKIKIVTVVGTRPEIIRLSSIINRFNNSNFIAETFNSAAKNLYKDFSPIDDMRATKAYRMEVGKNLLLKCFFEIKNKKLLRVN